MPGPHSYCAVYRLRTWHFFTFLLYWQLANESKFCRLEFVRQKEKAGIPAAPQEGIRPHPACWPSLLPDELQSTKQALCCWDRFLSCGRHSISSKTLRLKKIGVHQAGGASRAAGMVVRQGCRPDFLQSQILAGNAAQSLRPRDFHLVVHWINFFTFETRLFPPNIC